MSDIIEVPFGEDNYIYVFDKGCSIALKNGKFFRDLTGDDFMYCFAYELLELREKIRKTPGGDAALPIISERKALQFSMPTEINIDDGKYCYNYESGHQTVYRYGELWRDLINDELDDELAFAFAIEFTALASYYAMASTKVAKEEVQDDQVNGIPIPEDVRSSINHALDLMSKHGDGLVSVGAMTILEKFLENPEPAKTETIVDLPPCGEMDNPGMGFPAEWESYSSEYYRKLVIRRLNEAGISAKVGDKVHHP